MKEQQTHPDDRLEPPPEYVLGLRYDDEDDPTEVTLFPWTVGKLSTTEWLTANVDSIVSLDNIR